nr:unnamed protein product [Callosobruchus analis]CAI5844764.1 unnamed protein product [Callosobruchus analis]
MFGQHHSISTLFAKGIPNLFLMKCIRHSFHLCASYACKKLPQGMEDFARIFKVVPNALETTKNFNVLIMLNHTNFYTLPRQGGCPCCKL